MLVGRAVGQRPLRPPADLVDLLVRRVHPAVDVDVPALPVVLVVDRPGGVAGASPLGHGGEVLSGAALVAEGPHDDARVVFVPFHHPAHPVQVGVPPARVVARVTPPAHRVEPVRLQVALVDHPHAQLVAELQKARVRRVVAGAYGIDVVLLHQQQIGAHHLLGQRAAVVRMPLVPVDALQDDAPAVHGQEAAGDRHGTEPDRDLHPLALGGEHAAVQPGHLGRPGLDGVDVVRPGRRHVGQAQLRHGQPRRHRGVHAQDPASGGVVVVGVHEEVVQPAGRPGEQGDVAEYAGQPPHVLVLQVTAG